MAEEYGFLPDEVMNMPMYQIRALLLGAKGCQEEFRAGGGNPRAKKVRKMLAELGFQTR